EAAHVPAEPPRLQTDPRVQEQMSSAKDAVLRSLRIEAETVASRLRATRTESEAIVTRAEELQQKLQLQMEKNQAYVQEASRQALGRVMEELQGKISQELAGSSAALIEQSRRQL